MQYLDKNYRRFVAILTSILVKVLRYSSLDFGEFYFGNPLKLSVGDFPFFPFKYVSDAVTIKIFRVP